MTILFSAVEAVIACLDRESVKKLVRIQSGQLRDDDYRGMVAEDGGPVVRDPQAEQAINAAVLSFLEALKKEGRRVLRQHRKA